MDYGKNSLLGTPAPSNEPTARIDRGGLSGPLEAAGFGRLFNSAFKKSLAWGTRFALLLG